MIPVCVGRFSRITRDQHCMTLTLPLTLSMGITLSLLNCQIQGSVIYIVTKPTLNCSLVILNPPVSNITARNVKAIFLIAAILYHYTIGNLMCYNRCTNFYHVSTSWTMRYQTTVCYFSYIHDITSFKMRQPYSRLIK